LHHNSPLPSLGNKILETPEIFSVPLIKVELVAADQIARNIASRPRHDQAGWFYPECVSYDELSHRLKKRSRINACVVQSVRLQPVEISDVVELFVDDGPIVLGGGDQNCWLAVKQEIMRIGRMKFYGLGTKVTDKQSQNKTPNA